MKNRIRASAGELLGPVLQPKPRLYHPSEDIDSEESDENGDAILRPAETSRTIIEANSKGLLMFSGLVNDGVYENIFLPDLPYVKGENGDIYFQVKNDEDVLETLASGDNLVMKRVHIRFQSGKGIIHNPYERCHQEFWKPRCKAMEHSYPIAILTDLTLNSAK